MAFGAIPIRVSMGIDPWPVRPTRRLDVGSRCRSSLVLIIASFTYKRFVGMYACIYVLGSSSSRVW